MDPIDVVVVGGGLAGWTAAATAARAGAGVVLVDRDGTGGRASTDEVGGFRFNRGAHALYTAGPGAGVLRDLGVSLAGADPQVRGAMGRIGDRLERLPIDPVSIARTRLLGRRSKTRLASLMAGFARRDPSAVAHLTIDAFLDDLDLPDDARAVLAAAFRLSSYVAEHGRVSADVAVTQLQLGSSGVRYLHGGWSRLVGELTGLATDQGARRLAQAATAVNSDGDLVEVITPDASLLARQVVLAAGNAATDAELLGHTPPEWRSLGPAGEASCLDVGLGVRDTPPLTIGIDEALYFNSHGVADLAPPGASVVHVMRYLRHDDPWSAREGRAQLEDHLWRSGVDPGSVRQMRYLHRMTVTSALPVPEHGGMAGRPSCTSTGDDRVLVAGDWVGPVGNLADAPIVSGAEAGRLAAMRSLRAAVR